MEPVGKVHFYPVPFGIFRSDLISVHYAAICVYTRTPAYRES